MNIILTGSKRSDDRTTSWWYWIGHGGRYRGQWCQAAGKGGQPHTLQAGDSGPRGFEVAIRGTTTLI